MAQNIGKVTVKFTGDTTELDKSCSQAEQKIGAMSKNASVALKAGLIGAAVIAVGTVTKLTKEIVKLGKESVELYGTYQQLEQGMAKIFDEVDQTQILTDAQNAWKDLNLSANEYMQNISGVGAVFAQTMGDQKGYDTARKGMKALADYATGTGGDIDNLMAKYQLITRQASQYQVIADQFAGILPQTSKDFLAQAQAAGILSDSYEKLADVPIVEYQEAVTAMIEKGVEQQGLLGNTAAETAQTLTGSISGAKAAIENLITGLANPEADIAALTKDALDAIKAAAKNIIPALGQAFKGIASFIKESLPELIDLALELLADIGPDLVNSLIDAVSAITDNSAEILGTIIQVAMTIVNMVLARLPEIIGMITNLIMGLIVAISKPENIRLIFQAMVLLLTGIIQALPVLIEQFSQNFPKLIANIVDLLTSPETLKQIFEATLVLLGAILTAIPTILGSLIATFALLISNLWNALKSNFQSFAASFGQGIGNAIAGAINKVLDFVESVLNGPINAINTVIDAINTIPGVDIGRLNNINIPRIQTQTAMAQGGLVTGPTRALIGEAGKEAVIPLERNQDNWSGLLAEALSEKMSETGGGAPVTIYMTNEINNKLDINEVARELATSIRRAI